MVPEDDNRNVYLAQDDLGGRLGRACRETEEKDTERAILIRGTCWRGSKTFTRTPTAGALTSARRFWRMRCLLLSFVRSLFHLVCS
jgi:hypothetical protein